MNGVVEVSFEQFFRKAYPGLVALGAWLTQDWTTGEDLAQKALEVTHRRWRKVSAYERPDLFTRRVLVNLASNERRRRGRERRAVRRLASLDVSGTQSDPGTHSDGVLDAEAPLWREVRALPANQRAAVGLRYVDDLTMAEIAEILECSESTVRVHLHRGRQQLATRLADPSGLPQPGTDIEESRR